MRSFTDPPQTLLEHESWLLRRSDGLEQRVTVRQASWAGQALRVSLEGVEDRDAAERLRGCDILVERSALPPVREHEYYQEDLLGFAVRTTDGTTLGQLSHFLDAPAGALMVVRGERERWIPAVARYLKRVDLGRREIEVDWPADF